MPWWLRGKECLLMQEMWVQSLSLEGPLEEGLATHSSVVCYLRRPMNRGAWLVTVHGVTKSPTQLQRLCTHTLSTQRTAAEGECSLLKRGDRKENGKAVFPSLVELHLSYWPPGTKDSEAKVLTLVSGSHRIAMGPVVSWNDPRHWIAGMDTLHPDPRGREVLTLVPKIAKDELPFKGDR